MRITNWMPAALLASLASLPLAGHAAQWNFDMTVSGERDAPYAPPPEYFNDIPEFLTFDTASGADGTYTATLGDPSPTLTDIQLSGAFPASGFFLGSVDIQDHQVVDATLSNFYGTLSFSNGTVSYSYDGLGLVYANFTGSIGAIPEPDSIALMLGGLLVVAAAARRRRA